MINIMFNKKKTKKNKKTLDKSKIRLIFAS